MLKQSKFTDHEINLVKNVALEKLHRQDCLKEYYALQILEIVLPITNWPIQI